MLFIISLAIAGKVAGSVLRSQGYSPEQITSAPYARNADLDSLRQIASRIGAGELGLESSQPA